MKIPEIIINDKAVKAVKPKAKVWRIMMEFDRDRAEIAAEDYISKYCDILSYIYPATKEEIEDGADIDEIYSAYHNAFMWITELLSSKLGKEEDDSKNVVKAEEEKK